MLHFAPVCSSWVWINRSSSGRSVADPLGDQSQPYVVQANVMVARVIYLALLGMCLGLHVIIEQPSSSIMSHHPMFKHFLALSVNKVITVHTVKTWFGMFGGTSPKPTILWGTPSWMPQLQRRLVKGKRWLVRTATHYVDKDGCKRVVGTKNLKGTQAYPAGYGAAVAKLWLQDPNVAQSDDENTPININHGLALLANVSHDAWACMDITGVLTIMRGAGFRLTHPMRGATLS